MFLVVVGVLFVIFVVNVLMGFVIGFFMIGIVGEMLLLFVVLIVFVVVIFKWEVKEKFGN